MSYLFVINIVVQSFLVGFNLYGFLVYRNKSTLILAVVIFLLMVVEIVLELSL